MKTKLQLEPHYVMPNAQVIELWYRGELIGTVVGADGPGVRIISKHKIVPKMLRDAQIPYAVELAIDVNK